MGSVGESQCAAASPELSPARSQKWIYAGSLLKVLTLLLKFHWCSILALDKIMACRQQVFLQRFTYVPLMQQNTFFLFSIAILLWRWQNYRVVESGKRFFHEQSLFGWNTLNAVVIWIRWFNIVTGITLPVTHSDHEGSFSVQAIEYASLRNLNNLNAYRESNKLWLWTTAIDTLKTFCMCSKQKSPYFSFKKEIIQAFSFRGQDCEYSKSVE